MPNRTVALSPGFCSATIQLSFTRRLTCSVYMMNSSPRTSPPPLSPGAPPRVGGPEPPAWPPSPLFSLPCTCVLIRSSAVRICLSRSSAEMAGVSAFFVSGFFSSGVGSACPAPGHGYHDESDHRYMHRRREDNHPTESSILLFRLRLALCAGFHRSSLRGSVTIPSFLTPAFRTAAMTSTTLPYGT